MNVSHPISSRGRSPYYHSALGGRAVARIYAPADIPTWKRTLDLTCILLTAPIWLPIMILVTLWIKLASPGPVFFKQERIGYRGKIFMIRKFRSMKLNAETSSHEQHYEQLIQTGRPMTKLDACDDRIIPGGRFLRATGLYELPHSVHGLIGDMSLVGPRPCLPREFARYDARQRGRVKAPPGMTGYWQVNGKDKVTFNQMIDMDLFYAEHMSVTLDLWIILRTPLTLLMQLFELKSQPKTATPRVTTSGASR